ncbi:MAG: hypothetical protein C0592_00325 [Marinilabiliales bacterium]|nr:MAG: hypothetical protein C0592_00325 [Marinilabiliales bacterium]
MKRLRRKYIRFQISLILKGFSIIGVLSLLAGCSNQNKDSTKTGDFKKNDQLGGVALQVDTVSVDSNNYVKTPTPEYDPSIEVICDYGVIQVVDPPEIAPNLYGVIPDIEDNIDQNE